VNEDMITEIITFKMEIHLAIPFPTSYGERHRPTDHVFVEIKDSSGPVGYGEGTALSFFTGETADSMKSLIDQEYAKPLVGMEIRDAIPWFRETITKIQSSPGANAGIEIALLDLYCKLREIPFYELFGFKVRDDVQCVYPIGAVNATQAAESAVDGVRNGFKTYKLKAHGQIDEDLERIAKVLAVMASDCKVRVDANQGWEDFEKASKVFTKLDNEDQIDYVEQPVSRENLSDLKKLHQEFNTHVFADESCHTPQEASNLLTNEMVDGLCLKMAKAGGPAQIKLMADLAREFKKNITMVSAFGTTLDERVWISLAGVIHNLSRSLEIGTWMLEKDPIIPSRGKDPIAKVSDYIGLGVSLDKSQL